MTNHITFIDTVIAFRKYSRIETLELAVERKLSRPQALQDELLIISAADHRRAEIATGKRYDAGKVPAYVWGLI